MLQKALTLFMINIIGSLILQFLKMSLKDYQLLGKLGSGAFGIVYKARDKKDNKICVIKQINISKLDTRMRNFVIRQAMNEAKIMRDLNSQYIVKFYASFVDKNLLNIAMQFCSGGDLTIFIKSQMGKPIKQQLIWKFSIQMMIGLRDLHSKKILHRDIKSLNVFLDAEKNIKIGDLGVAKQLKTDFTKTVVGTPYYLSPEMCEQKPYNEKTDIWAMGCLIYELCTGKHPFQAQNQASLALKIVTGKYKDIPNHYSKQISWVISSCLSVDHKRRPTASYLLSKQIIIQKAYRLGLGLESNSISQKQSNVKIQQQLKKQEVKIQQPIIKKESKTEKHFYKASEQRVQQIFEKQNKQKINRPNVMIAQKSPKQLNKPNSKQKQQKVSQNNKSLEKIKESQLEKLNSNSQKNKLSPNVKLPPRAPKVILNKSTEKKPKIENVVVQKQQNQTKNNKFLLSKPPVMSNDFKQKPTETTQQQKHESLKQSYPHLTSVSRYAPDNVKKKVEIDNEDICRERQFEHKIQDDDSEEQSGKITTKRAKFVGLIQQKMDDDDLQEFGIISAKKQAKKSFDIKKTKQIDWNSLNQNETSKKTRQLPTIKVSSSNQTHETKLLKVSSAEQGDDEIYEQIQDNVPYKSDDDEQTAKEQQVIEDELLIQELQQEQKSKLQRKIIENQKRKMQLIKLKKYHENSVSAKIKKQNYDKLKETMIRGTEEELQKLLNSLDLNQKQLMEFLKIRYHDLEIQRCGQNIKGLQEKLASFKN